MAIRAGATDEQPHVPNPSPSTTDGRHRAPCCGGLLAGCDSGSSSTGDQPAPNGPSDSGSGATNPNSTLPLLRYEVTDQLALLPTGLDDRPWTGQLLSPPSGRADDWFRWPDGTELHPHVVRSVLAQSPAIIEYQVRQTAVGVDVDVTLVASVTVDTDDLARRLSAQMCSTGIAAQVVNLRRATSLPRHAHSAKLRRFIPLTADAEPVTTGHAKKRGE